MRVLPLLLGIYVVFCETPEKSDSSDNQQSQDIPQRTSAPESVLHSNRLIIEWSKDSQTGRERQAQISSIALDEEEEFNVEEALNEEMLANGIWSKSPIKKIVDRIYNGRIISFIRARTIPELRRFVKKVKEVKRLNGLGVDIIELDSEDDAGELMKELQREGSVLSVELDHPTFLSRVIPNDQYFTTLWGLDQTNDIDVNAPEMWTQVDILRTDAETPVVAVLDTGADLTHPDLVNRLWKNTGEIPNNGKDDDGNGYVDDYYGYNFINRAPNPQDDNNHGSHCSGTILADINNNVGVVGIYPKALLMALKTMDSRGAGSYSAAIEALNYAASKGAMLTSNSWGGSAASPALLNALRNARILHVCAAGNDSKNIDSSPQYPAAYTSALDNVISVAAIAKDGSIASFSNYGKTNVDLGAPGVSIYSTCNRGIYCSMSGTSMATPHVAGVATATIATVMRIAKQANVLASSIWPTPAELKQVLSNTGKTLNSLSAKTRSGKTVDALAAVKQIASITQAKVPSNPTTTTTTTRSATPTTTTTRAGNTTTTTKTATTTTTKAAARDCIVGEWGPWSECSTQCGMGQKSRTRTTTPPQSGGAACPYNKEVQTCVETKCPSAWQRAFWELIRRTQSSTTSNAYSMFSGDEQDTGDVDIQIQPIPQGTSFIHDEQ